ncbi:MAG: hypothetical protein AB7N76_05360 [Planctomycetota bacterium]
MPSEVLQLEDEDFWKDPEKTRKQVVQRVSQEDLLGLLVDAPGYVSLDDRESCPVVGYYVRTLLEDQQIEREKQLFALAIDLTTGDLRYGLAVNTGKTPAPRQKPTGTPPKGKTLDAFSCDLRHQVDLPWRAGKHRVHAILRERRSNPVTVELGPSPTKFQDPEVAKFLAERQTVAAPPPPPAVWPRAWRAASGFPPERWPAPERRVPWYGPEVQGPEIPAEPGIALDVERVVELEPRARCLLRGSFRLPVRRREVVRPDPETGERPDVGDPEATGVVPITIFITGSENPGPWVFQIQVPVRDPLASEGEPGLATGRFVIDLLGRFDATPRLPMTYFLYAFNGEHALGPIPYALVEPPVL